ncbi:hypothetical protein ACSLNT_29245, partial [Escherichia coli]
LLTIVLFFSISANAVTVNQFQRELDLADKAILWALISASTQDGPKAFKQLCVKNPSRLYVSVFADGTKRIPLGFLLVAPGLL